MNNNKVQRSIVLPQEQLEELNKIAKRKYMSVNDVIRLAVAEYIKTNKVNNNVSE